MRESSINVVAHFLILHIKNLLKTFPIQLKKVIPHLFSCDIFVEQINPQPQEWQ